MSSQTLCEQAERWSERIQVWRCLVVETCHRSRERRRGQQELDKDQFTLLDILLKLHIFATRRYRYDALHRGHGVRDRARATAHDTAEKNI